MAEQLTPPSVAAIADVLREARTRELRSVSATHPSIALSIGLAVLVFSLGGTYFVAAVEGRHHLPAVAFVLLLWCGARITQATLADTGATLGVESLRVLPIPPRRLAAALALGALSEPDLVFLMAACSSLVVAGALHGPVAAVLGALAAVELVALTAIVSLVVRHALAAARQRGRDLGTLLGAALLALFAGLSAAYPLLASTLTAPHPGVVPTLVGLSPPGWAADAVHAVADGRTVVAVTWLAALLAATLLAAAVWPWVLARRLRDCAVPTLRGGRRRHRPLLATPRWAVTVKELSLWTRDPLRITFLILAAVIGVAPGIVAAAGGDRSLLPFAGALSVAIACACAVNLYGAELDSLWLTLTVPDVARADVRGRQLGWLLVVAPYALGLSLVLTAFGGRGSEWPWILSVMPALLGAGSGIAVLGSLIWVLGPDADGGPTPSWSLKIHAALWAAVAPAVAPVAMLVAGTVTDHDVLRWLAVPVGIVVGVGGYRLLGRLAIERLARVDAELLAHA